MKTLIVCALAAAVSACSASNHTASPTNAPASATPPASASTPTSASTPASASAPASPSAQAPAQNPQDAGWRLLQGTSPMDGREFVATKTYTPDSGVQMIVTFKCLADTQRLHVTINSMVGDPNNPSQRSAFQKYEDTAEEAVFDSRVPIMKLAGRIRFGSLQPQALSGIFSVDDHFANEIVADLSPGTKPPLSSNQAAASLLSAMSNIMTGSAPTVDSIYTAYAQLAGSSSANPGSTPSGFNPIAGLHELFPIGVELVNGAGTYDLSIPYADQINFVLDQCGGAEPVLRSAGGTSQAADPQSVSPAPSMSSSGG